MLLSVDAEKCNRDGKCVEACGRHNIEMNDQDAVPTSVVGAECSNCGHCVAVCPTGALSLDNMKLEDCPDIRRDLMVSVEQTKQFLRSRRSIRSYSDKPVGREKLNELIQIAGYAPSGHNARPVQLLVIEGSKAIRGLSSLVIDWMRLVIKDYPDLAERFGTDRLFRLWSKGEDPICRDASHLIIAHAKSGGMTREDCILALSYMELAAGSLGLGATWAGYVMVAARSSPPLIDTMNLPEGHECYGALMVGYPTLNFVRLPLRNPPPVTWHTSE
jgi:nitroreductase/NAD-dependent dihydropyrimidine dehydrogenase PreA subunit